MPLDLRRALPADLPALQQMLELYQYELSDIWPQDTDEQARYGYDLSRHFEGKRFHAHLALDDGRHAGFALVAPAAVTRTEGCWMEQFFILKRHRRKGAGRALARHVLQAHPGPWEVGQMPANPPAQAFWRRVIGELTNGAYSEVQVTQGDWQGVVQRFEVPPPEADGNLDIVVPFAESHADAFAQAARRSRRLHGRFAHPPTTPDAALDLARRRQGPSHLGFVVVDGATGTLQGYVEVTQIVHGAFRSAYLGYHVFSGHERRGVMTAALRQVIAHCQRSLKLNRLEANIQPENVASIALVRSLGFRREGCSPSYLRIGGRWRDHERWAWLAPSRRAATATA
jgi:RimJ/RimL family protein N-acetyltransferase/predicted acetyltransferase